MTSPRLTALAPAKVNLYLHVGAVRADGLHDLDSLFFFLDDGDIIEATPADEISLTIDGPFAAALAGEDVENNLVVKAARRLCEKAGVDKGARLVLRKALPVAAGVGGGSADAAAALRVLQELWGVDLDPSDLAALAFSLGADVPACLSAAPVRVSGAGEILRPGPVMAGLWACLVNPRIPMATGPIFRAFDEAGVDPGPLKAALPARLDADVLPAVMNATRNDLQPFAARAHAAVDAVCHFLLSSPGALAARMSGSGATCFGLFATPGGARKAAEKAQAQGWWSMAAQIISGENAAPDNAAPDNVIGRGQ